MNVVPIIKSVAGLATSLSAGVVVGNAIKATTPSDLKKVQKVAVVVGGAILSSLAGDLAANYVEGQVQALADGIKAGFLKKGEVYQAAENLGDAAASFSTTAAEAAARTVKDAFTEDEEPRLSDDHK